MKENDYIMSLLFNSEGQLRRGPELTAAFLRPVYQYTSIEIRNTQRENMEKEYSNEFSN